jgi:hypothetical protein
MHAVLGHELFLSLHEAAMQLLLLCFASSSHSSGSTISKAVQDMLGLLVLVEAAILCMSNPS